MLSRVHMFHCTSVFVPPGEVRPEIAQCAHHLAKWLCEGATAFDARSVLGVARVTGHAGVVVGLDELVAASGLPEALIADFKQEVSATGALHVNEFCQDDRPRMQVWGRLREMERRRLLHAAMQHLG